MRVWAESLEGLAGVVVNLGAGPDAARLIGLADAIRQQSATPRLGVHQPGYERDVAMIEAAVGPDGLAAFIIEGAAISQEDLLERLPGNNNGPGPFWGATAAANLTQ